MENCCVSVAPIFPAGCSACRNPESYPVFIFRCGYNPKATEKGLLRKQDLLNKKN